MSPREDAPQAGNGTGDPARVDAKVAALIEKLTKFSNAETLSDVQRDLVRIGQPAVPRLESALGSDDFERRGRSALVLADLKATSSVPAVIRQLERESHEAARWALAEALAKFGDPRALPALRGALARTQRRHNREAIERAIEVVERMPAAPPPPAPTAASPPPAPAAASPRAAGTVEVAPTPWKWTLRRKLAAVALGVVVVLVCLGGWLLRQAQDAKRGDPAAVVTLRRLRLLEQERAVDLLIGELLAGLGQKRSNPDTWAALDQVDPQWRTSAPARKLVGKLVRMALSGDERFAQAALSSFDTTWPNSPAGQEALRAVAHDAGFGLSVCHLQSALPPAALEYLRGLGPESKNLVLGLVHCLAADRSPAPDEAELRSVKDTLVSWGPAVGLAEQELREVTKGSHYGARLAAFVLATVPAMRQRAMRELVGLLRDAYSSFDPYLRQESLRIFGELGPSAREGVGELLDGVWSERQWEAIQPLVAIIAPTGGHASPVGSWDHSSKQWSLELRRDGRVEMKELNAPFPERLTGTWSEEVPSSRPWVRKLSFSLSGSVPSGGTRTLKTWGVLVDDELALVTSGEDFRFSRKETAR